MATRRRNLGPTSIVVACLLIAACGSDGPSSSPAPTEETESTTPATAASTAPQATDVTASSGDATPTTSTTDITTTTASPVSATLADRNDIDGVASVTEYLDHLAAEEYDQAAAMLGEGGSGWDDRFDISALPRDLTTGGELAAALRAWCAGGALCTTPTTIVGQPAPDGFTTDITVTWGSGDDAVTATMIGRMWEGAPAVNGLPPLTSDTSIPMLLSATGSSTAVVGLPDGRTLAWDGVRTIEIPVPVDASPWSDGEFVYWTLWNVDEGGDATTTSAAATLGGELACEVEGDIHRARQRSDGEYVASVERYGEVDHVEPYVPGAPIPNYAIDCSTGDVQPIAPRSFDYEGGPIVTTSIGGRQFTFDYDAEGFGPVARTLEETLDALEQTLARGCVVEGTYAERADAAFGYRDAHNCERVVEAIVQRSVGIR